MINIIDKEAPKEYQFKIKLPVGSSLVSAKDYLGEENDTKEVFIINSDNIITNVFSPAWAKDANGENIPTNYKVIGNTLVQTVDFDNNSAFPIVADPDFWKITKCAGAVTMAIGTIALPVAKIGKIKSYIKALGGIKEAVMLLVGATSAAEKGEAVIQAFMGLASELTGIAGIAENCF